MDQPSRVRVSRTRLPTTSLTSPSPTSSFVTSPNLAGGLTDSSVTCRLGLLRRIDKLIRQNDEVRCAMLRTTTLDEVRLGPPMIGVAAASALIGISRSYGFELARRGEFPCRVVKVGS